MYRKVKKEELVGKTIKRIDNSGMNMLILYFTDNTSLLLEADETISGLNVICVWDDKLERTEV